MACRSDAGKFCAEHIGKPPQMNACLRANKAKLSDGCRKSGGIARRLAHHPEIVVAGFLSAQREVLLGDQAQ